MAAKVLKKWDVYKAMEVAEKVDYHVEAKRVTTLNGQLTEWDNPELLWILSYSEDGGYDGSGMQVGLTKDGKFVWEYQSHCSCYGFSDTKGHDPKNELCLGCEEKPKSHELNMLPAEWEKIVYVNLQEILKK